jgi:hypothetical protein
VATKPHAGVDQWIDAEHAQHRARRMRGRACDGAHRRRGAVAAERALQSGVAGDRQAVGAAAHDVRAVADDGGDGEVEGAFGGALRRLHRHQQRDTRSDAEQRQQRRQRPPRMVAQAAAQQQVHAGAPARSAANRRKRRGPFERGITRRPPPRAARRRRAAVDGRRPPPPPRCA